MTEAEAKAEFFAEVSGWGDMLAARRAGQAEGGVAPSSGDPAAEWRSAARVLRAGRLVYGYGYLFTFIAGLLIILAVIGAILMVQRVVRGAGV